MEYKIRNFKIIVEETADAWGKQSAAWIVKQLHENPASKIGFATGGTPVAAYKELIELYNEGKLDFSRMITFNLDEYYPIRRDNNQSYYYFMQENLFSHINVNPDNVHIPNGEATDIAEECVQYEKQLEAAGYLDLQILGIGPNGHIAFNEPDDHFEPNTHHTTLDKKTIEANARFFNSIDEVPTHAVTMGIQSIMASKKILLLANSASKSEVLESTVFGKITPQLPASVLQLHHDVTMVLTADCADGILAHIR